MNQTLIPLYCQIIINNTNAFSICDKQEQLDVAIDSMVDT